ADGVLYVVSQNACGMMQPGPVTYKGQTINGFVYTGSPSSAQNSTLYAIDMSTGKTLWQFAMPYRYQAASAVASGGVVYVVDRGGDLYALDAQTGKVLKSVSLGGLGAAGVSMGTTLSGGVELVVPVGGGDLPQATGGIVLAFALGAGASPGPSSGVVYVAGAVVAAGLVVAYALSRRRGSPRVSARIPACPSSRPGRRYSCSWPAV
ncbi:MAG: PQQ-binding-like beta-propeller repeat protein, partial [Nitrososphaerota archaeon]|nr:PQQ-binding-like beta-propeller repeat protein [Nitrososphaerota archaeon]